MKANGLKMVSIRLVDDPPIYSEDKIQNRMMQSNSY